MLSAKQRRGPADGKSGFEVEAESAVAQKGAFIDENHFKKRIPR